MSALVSVLVPAFHSEGYIGDAVLSALSGDWEDIEVIVAPDDGVDYRSILPPDPRVVILPPGPIGTGAGPARNRALDHARGDMIALLDSDDLWSPGYLSGLIPHAMRHGAAFGITRITTWGGNLVRRLPGGWSAEAGFGTFERLFGPLRSVVRREHAGRFVDLFAEDLLWELEILSCLGGVAPLVHEAEYTLRLRPGSTSGGRVSQAEIDAAYATLIDGCRHGRFRLRPEHRLVAADVFTRFRAVNSLFTGCLALAPGASYHDFVHRLEQVESVSPRQNRMWRNPAPSLAD